MSRIIRAPGRNIAVNDTVAKLNPQVFPAVNEQAMQMEMNRRLQIRPSSDEEKLNQNERHYLEWLKGSQPQWHGIQCITLKLGYDCRYTPDFWALYADGLHAIDVKGAHVWEDSLIKLRVAARLFPWITFIIAKRNGEIWEHKTIKL